MKHSFLIIIVMFFLTGCVYQRPYGGYSRYSTTITTPYPSRYQEQRYYTPAPPRYVIQPTPYFRSYDQHREHEHEHHRSHDHNERGGGRSQSHQRW